ncbi:two-component system, NarL family, sensor histidine kinase DesK [Mesobacillus persicus]|uniref:histidine kinase n=1 Tax=Mesobacillus persicus TaxID=930146 RepID=A0A1H7YY23_9BACI|nr:sensor histidine kinase [Mesobacillus persicus]SEM51046.1 two-component system, NarL family, sensor histidine kinase DesK [Mesobacillus persicus]
MLQRMKGLKIFPARYGLFPYVFLIYLVMPAYYVSIEQGWTRIAGIGLLLLFLVTYRQLYNSFDKKAYTNWLVVQVAIILILAIFYDLYNIFLGFFTANFIGWYKSKKMFYRALGLFILAIITPVMIHWKTLPIESIYFNAIFILIMLISPFGIRSMSSRMELEQKLNEANEQIKELVKRDERMRIARDLHDTLGHTLSMITLKSQLVHKLISKDLEKAKLETKEIERSSRSALKQVRELVSDMRAITVAEELIETESILQTAGISFRFEGDSKLADVPLLTQNILSMCLKEGVTNVVKHSQANNCVVQVVKKAGEIELTVLDDGKGLEGTSSEGNGLKGINERLRLIDGLVKIISQKGTKLIITVPIIVKEKKAGVGS